MLRKLLVGSANYILGPIGSDSDLRRHGEKIASRGGRTPRNVLWSRLPESSRCCCIGCGSPQKYTSHCATRIGLEARQLSSRDDLEQRIKRR